MRNPIVSDYMGVPIYLNAISDVDWHHIEAFPGGHYHTLLVNMAIAIIAMESL